ncbi:MAG: CHAP domain-containing protein, partial [Bifidobacteriaceae bacterium]|nr:CHAP domain-containing protein [Bifidobacteriaceae bacterium]
MSADTPRSAPLTRRAIREARLAQQGRARGGSVTEPPRAVPASRAAARGAVSDPTRLGRHAATAPLDAAPAVRNRLELQVVEPAPSAPTPAASAPTPMVRQPGRHASGPSAALTPQVRVLAEAPSTTQLPVVADAEPRRTPASSVTNPTAPAPASSILPASPAAPTPQSAPAAAVVEGARPALALDYDQPTQTFPAIVATVEPATQDTNVLPFAGPVGAAPSGPLADVIPLTRAALRAQAAAPGLPEAPELVTPPDKLPAWARAAHPKRLITAGRRKLSEATASRPSPDGEVIDAVGLFARKAMKPLTAAAGLAAAASLVYAVVPAHLPATSAAEDVNALTPLRETVELVTQRTVSATTEASRYYARTAMAEAAVVTSNSALKVSERGTTSIKLKWAFPNGYKATVKDRVLIRRTPGKAAAATVKDGTRVTVASPTATSVLDSGLQPDTQYTYAVFLQRSGLKPELVATATVTTRAHPVALAPGDSLVAGEELDNDTGGYVLVVTKTGELQLKDAVGNVIWSPTDTAVKGAQLVMGTNGNLTFGTDTETVWQTKTTTPGAQLKLTDTGDVRVVADGKVLWSRAGRGDISRGDDYPFGWGSPLGYAPRNCTDFVAWRLNEYAGYTHSPWKYTHNSMTPNGGNAVQWAQYFKGDNTPKLGSVAWWGSDHGGGYGHVAIVTAVHADGSITIEEYNY